MNYRWFITGLVGAGLVVWLTGPVHADVKPHALISDGMVLQQGVACPIWGKADPGEEVSFTLDFGGKRFGGKGAAADRDGNFRFALPVLKAGGPFQLTLQGKNQVVLKEVYVGEVWVCSGQSNMAWTVRQSADAEKHIAASKNSKLRLFSVPRKSVDMPQTDVAGAWKECSPDTVGSFSAVGYFFGRDLQKALDVPVGLIDSSVGGTPAEAWTSKAGLASRPEFKTILTQYATAQANLKAAQEKHKEAVAKAKAEGKTPPPAPRLPHLPSGLYNGMIAPLQPYAVKGAIWYQGESNAGRAHQYRTLFPAMIRSWRADWKSDDLSFLFVQLAPFRKIQAEPMESDWAELREAQLLTAQRVPKTGMAVITDVGDEKDIHPKQKEPVGARLALAARAITYGEKIVHSGPVYDGTMKVEGNRAVLGFKHVGGGLVAKGGPLTGFTICGEDRKFVKAEAEIREDRVIVWSPKVEKPVAVRFGWADCPVVNLWNKEGLPATPFRTDDFPMLTAPKTVAGTGAQAP